MSRWTRLDQFLCGYCVPISSNDERRGSAEPLLHVG